MDYIDRILTPQIKSENVTYTALVEEPRIIEVLSQQETNHVSITKDSISIWGKTDQETYQGINYVKQLEIYFDGLVPECEFEFYSPKFKYRGFLIDVCRHFMPVDELKRIIKAMALAGYNVFHWHLTDDQAWRFTVEGYPKLETISSKRSYTEYNNYAFQHEGIYTDEELKEIVEFCNNNFITVVPEVELPGHATALLAAYPEFGCTGKKIEVATTWGIFEDVMNPASKELWIFIEKVLQKFAAIFPGPYICIGGDECPRVQWDNNEDCQLLMKENNLKDGSELQGWFTSKVAKLVSKCGKRALGWDEVIDSPDIDSSVVVMSWRGMEGAKTASKRGHNVILCPQQGFYLDKGYTNDDFEPKQWGVYSLKQSFDVDIQMKELPENQRELILGAQCNLWCEQIHNGREAEYMLFPRTFVIADSLWLGDDKDWERTKLRKDQICKLCYKMDLVASPARWEE